MVSDYPYDRHDTSTNRRRQRRSRALCCSSNTTTTPLSIFSKLAIISVAYVLLFCTSHHDVFAYSEKKRVIGSQNSVETQQEQEQEQNNKPLLSSLFRDHDAVQQNINNIMLYSSETNLLRDNHSSDAITRRRRVQRRGDPIAQEGNLNDDYDPYGVPPTSNTNDASGSNNNNDANKGIGWFGKKQNDEDSANSSKNNADTTGSAAYGISGSSSAYGSYGSSPSSTSSYGSYGSAAGSSSSTYSGYGSYGSSPSSSYGASPTSSYGSSPTSASSSYYGGSSYSSTWGTGSASSTSHQWGSNTNNNVRGGKGLHPVKIDLFKAIFFLLLISTTGMLLTAHSLEHHPEGTFANCCRVSLHTVSCVYSIIYNLYHCRLGEIPGIICGGSELTEDEYTEEELERMNLRPGIERALDTEHRKALRKVGVEMNMIKPKNGSSKANGVGGKSKGVRNGASNPR